MKKSVWMAMIAIVITSAIFYACGKSNNGDSTGGGTATDTFKTAMLVNYADNLIIPAYTSFQQQLTSMEASFALFQSAPSANSQQSLKTAFKNAYVSYEGISLLYFGPASATQLNAVLNSFPCNTQKIESAVTSGNYNLTLPISSDSLQGFPALDYLFFSTDAVQKFADGNSGNRKKYVQDVIARMKSLSDNVLSQWKDSFRNSFTGNIKLDAGSSIGYLVNQFAYEMDQLKGPRIGWPFGKQSNNIVFADKCEGYYGGFSAALAIANLTSLKNYYTGGAGRGIDDYLILLQKSTLNTSVLNQFDIALNALKAIPEPMSDAFTNNKPVIETAYKEVQKLLTLIKTDVASATSIRITYQDTDGD